MSPMAWTFPESWWSCCVLIVVQRIAGWCGTVQSRGSSIKFHSSIRIFVYFLWWGGKFISANTNSRALFIRPPSSHFCFGCVHTAMHAPAQHMWENAHSSCRLWIKILCFPSRIPAHTYKFPSMLNSAPDWEFGVTLRICLAGGIPRSCARSPTAKRIRMSTDGTHTHTHAHTHFLCSLPALHWDFSRSGITSHILNSSNAQSTEPERFIHPCDLMHMWLDNDD